MIVVQDKMCSFSTSSEILYCRPLILLIHVVINWRQAREEWFLGVTFHLGCRATVSNWKNTKKTIMQDYVVPHILGITFKIHN